MDKLLLLIVLSDMRNALRTADEMNFCVYPGVPDPVLITRLCTFSPTLLTYFLSAKRQHHALHECQQFQPLSLPQINLAVPVSTSAGAVQV